MARLYAIVFLAMFAGAAATGVTPIEKVISLIEGMRDDVTSQGNAEGKAYESFACFCKDTTGTKSRSVQKGTEKIGLLSSDIADKTQERKEDNTELSERKQKNEELNSKLDETDARCAKQKAEYEAEAADLSKAIQGLEDALKSMKTSKPSLISIRQTLGKTFAMADAMNLLKAPKHKAVAAFLQESNTVDPSDPEYNFHSDDIIQVCDDLLVEYKQSKSDLDTEWGKTKKGCDETKASLKKSIGANDSAMAQLEKDIQRLGKEIAQHREDLITADGLLKDDEVYLKDMTARCEDRANDYDQRSAMRNDELTALNGALKVLKGTVKARADFVNVRALIQESTKESAPIASQAPTKATFKSVSFLQQDSESVQSRAFLGLTQQARKDHALNILRTEGRRIQSLTLTSLAEKASGNPFKKIKGLIQKLIERLLEESKNEATKKGFCDTELAKARHDRDARFQEAKDLSADLAGLEAKRDELNAEIKDLTEDIKQEKRALKETTEDRKFEKDNNMENLKIAKDGLDGVNEALLILRSFYKQAAKASFVQASPVDEDTSGPGFSGNYKGDQSSSKAVLDLLETIASDFDRTLRKTEESEAAAHREYVAFSQASESSIAGKTTKKELDEEDLKTTMTSLATKTDDLQTAMDLLDSALKTLEDLKPTCIDTGMSYAERVKKREEEMNALGKALCILDEEGVEADCTN